MVCLNVRIITKLKNKKFTVTTFTLLQSVTREIGYDEDTYAEETDRYNNLEGALQCLIQDAGFELPAQLEFNFLGGENNVS